MPQVESQVEDGFVTVTVTVPAKRCGEAYDVVLAKLRKDYNVPGFRNNEKVPASMLFKVVGGIQNFHMACTEEVLHSSVEEVRSRPCPAATRLSRCCSRGHAGAPDVVACVCCQQDDGCR